MQYELPTLQISDGHGGFITINESDFDPKLHKKHGEEADPGSRNTLDSLNKPELIETAEAKGIDTKGMTKAEIIAALEDKEKT